MIEHVLTFYYYYSITTNYPRSKVITKFLSRSILVLFQIISGVNVVGGYCLPGANVLGG